jgi:hypothetical protein
VSDKGDYIFSSTRKNYLGKLFSWILQQNPNTCHPKINGSGGKMKSKSPSPRK